MLSFYLLQGPRSCVYRTFNHSLSPTYRTTPQAKFPDFVVGFDLVGQEDPGRPLIDFADQILTLPSDLKLFFHAGETNWNGVTDDNMVSVGGN